MSKPIGTLGTVDTLTIGGRVLTDLTTSLFMLGGSIDTTHNYATIRKLNSTSGYQVTTGKTLTIVAVRVATVVGGASSGITLIYGDTDVGFNSNTAPTNAVYAGGTLSTYVQFASTANVGISEFACNFTIPALKYPGIYINGSQSNAVLFGYEA